MKKRTRRKVWALVNPVQHAIDGAVITPQKLLDELRMLELAHLAAMRDGTAGLAQWRALTDVLNLCDAMARGGIGPEALEACERAEQALIDAAGTAETTLAHALMDGMIDPNVEDRFETWLQELIAAAHNARAALAAMDTPKGGDDE